MAGDNGDFRYRLQQLDQELEEGEITKKGYEKRRTLLLSEYGTSSQPAGKSTSPQRRQSPPMSTRQASIGSRLDFPGDGDRSYSSLDPLHFSAPANQHLRPANPERMQSYSSSLGPSSDAPNNHDVSRTHTLARADYAFNPAEQDSAPSQPEQALMPSELDGRMSTMLESQQGYFSDFTGDQMPERDSYGGPQRYSTGEALSPTAFPPMMSSNDLPSTATIHHQAPLEPRDIPFNIFDPHNSNTQMSSFETIGAVLRHRGKTHPKQPAYWVLDVKGKETASITWEKLASKAEKVAQVIRDKSNLYRGDRVALIYRDSEVIDFVIALMGCFIAGVVAVPLNCVGDYQKLSLLLMTTQAHLALTTDNNLKNFHRDITNNKLKWPTGVEWWKTNEFGSYHPKKKEETPPLQVPDLAYIEFSRAPTGDLRGVVLSHRTIMHQMATLSAIIAAIPDSTDTFSRNLRDKNGDFVVRSSRTGETILTYLDPRDGVGMILGVLLGVYGGHTTVWMEPKTPETAGLYAHLITRYRANILVADYSRLKFSAYNYQQDPMATRQFKKGMEPNFSSVKLCLIDALTVDTEFHEILADRWFKPMRNDRARDVVAPMLCLPEHGGMIVSVRDWLGGEERMGCALADEPVEETHDPELDPSSVEVRNGRRSSHKESRRDLSEVLLDKEALKTNEVVVLAYGDDAKRRSGEVGTVRCGAFGYPIPDATLAVVDPETSLLCSAFTVGEIWVDSPSLSGGFWSLPKHTETIFHARPYRFVDGSPTPVLLDMEFLRTGLLGCVIEGKLYVLGLYEDRIRQKVEWTEHGVQEEHRYYFVQHLVSSIMRNIPKIHDCSAFDVYVNGEYLPIILIETLAASTAPLVPGGPPRQLDIPLLDSLSERCMEVLFHEHHLRVYCVMITAPNTLPKVVKNGRAEIGNMLCRKEFDNGALPCVHVQFGVERAVQNLPFGDDPVGGVWSMASSSAREDLLLTLEKQYSGVDHREVIMDDRTSTPLNQFNNIHDLLQWRVSRQGEELAYCTIDSRGKEGKGVNWKKMDLKIAAVAIYLKNKVKVTQGDHILLMYTHSEEFVYAVHACFVLGAIAIPMAPLDANRLSEDVPATLNLIRDFKIKAILVNSETDQLMKQKTVSQHLKQSAMVLRVTLPGIYNTTKPSKQSHGCPAPTYLVSPVDFAQNPLSLFLTLSRYKIKDTYATSQMLDHAMVHMVGKGFALHDLKNLMISTETRPRLDIYQKTRVHFAQAGLDRTAINTIYSHVLNPMIASRSYMCVEPIELWLDPKSLRRGLIQPVDPDTEPFALLVQDSGMVPVSTQIAIVNPETNYLCHIGEFGEIWVQSEACVQSFYGSQDPLDVERFNGRTVDGDSTARYVRTGDLGFLHNVSRPIGPGGALVDMQVLFVLGSIGETFDVNGLNHFPTDIENSVEKCHRNVAPGGSAVFQAGGLVVVLVEVMRKNFLASMVPVIVNAILNSHQVVIDIVAFVSRGDFPRSRLGEKQRGKILAGWVTRKMRTIAQFGIKDPDAPGEESGLPRRSAQSFRSASARGGSSLKHVESSTGLADLQEQDYAPLPTGVSEMPGTMDDSSIIESPPPPPHALTRDDTPTESRPLPPQAALDYSPVEMPVDAFYGRDFHRVPSSAKRGQTTRDDFNNDGHGGDSASRQPTLNLPSVDGRGSLLIDDEYTSGTLGGTSGLRVANRSSSSEDADWPHEARMYMNLGSSGGREYGER
ncbi:MAG: putative NRPS-like protein biosynthetic cluster [Alyxoria varia]|nr:MAG: putative NRPS-like protein biosynthetic cluster [Alyxoria varia]